MGDLYKVSAIGNNCQQEAQDMVFAIMVCVYNIGILYMEKSEICKISDFLLYNENPQLNWGFKKLKAMGRKK